MRRFQGLYRGIVKDNDDSQTSHPYLGRLKVYVPEVYGKDVKDNELPWAWPLFPAGGEKKEGKGCGFVWLPRVGASVWVIFEKGDPRRPVWLGTWYGEKDASPEMPEEARQVDNVRYPEIILFKSPYKEKGIWLRFARDQKLDLVFEDEKEVITFDGLKKKLQVWAEEDNWQIEVRATGSGGRISLEAEEIEIQAKERLKITGKTVSIDGEERAELHSSTASIVSSGSAIYGKAPHASGFEDH